MRVMTFNIQHALDHKNQVIDTSFFARKIKEYGAEICGLNEVRGEGPLEGYTDQTNSVADILGFYRYFGEAIKVKGTSPYGNALIAGKPFKSVETVRIPDPVITGEINRDGEPVHYESRVIIKAIFEVENKDICVLVTHMGLALSERINAVKTLCNIIDETDIPIIVMGDFNSTPDEEILKPLYERLSDTDSASFIHGKPTFASYKPEIKIDYILYRGLKCIYAETVEEIISDHYPVIADFEFQE